MLRVRIAVLVAGAAVLSGCMTSLPTPDYTVKTPPPYRVSPEGVRIDNEDYALDAEGYRLDKQGNRIGDVDVQAKTAGEQSNAMAGYYISSTGANAPGKVASVSDGTTTTSTGYGNIYGTAVPSSSGMPAPTSVMTGTTMPPPPANALPPAQIPPPATAAPVAPPATGAPVPLNPSTK